MAIVAGTSYLFFEEVVLNIAAACLPSLRPIIFPYRDEEPRSSVRDTRGKVFMQYWTGCHPSAEIPCNGQPTIASNRQHSFVPLNDEECGFSGMEQIGAAITCSGGRRIRDWGDVEIQRESPRASSIQVRKDVVVQSIQNT